MTPQKPVEGTGGNPERSSGLAPVSSTPTKRIVAISFLTALLFNGLGMLMGARNSSGVYSLPSSVNPVVTGTTITANWANTTLQDLGTEVTNSLDRAGRSAMTAPLPLANGTVSAPALTFASSTGDGLYRIGAHDIGFTLNGVKAGEWASSGTTFSVFNSGSSAVTPSQQLASGLTNGSYVNMLLGRTAAANDAASIQFTPNATAGLSKACIDVFGQSQTLCVDGQPKVYVGATGTGISGSFGNTYNFAAGTIASGTCNSSAQTLTGVSVGGVCNVSPDAELGGGSHLAAVPYCAVTGANTVTIYVCNGGASSLISGAGNYRVRVWQP